MKTIVILATRKAQKIYPKPPLHPNYDYASGSSGELDKVVRKPQ
jgi:uncharacterized membrane-anchored protein YhcB (DUF1043 family)